MFWGKSTRLLEVNAQAIEWKDGQFGILGKHSEARHLGRFEFMHDEE